MTLPSWKVEAIGHQDAPLISYAISHWEKGMLGMGWHLHYTCYILEQATAWVVDNVPSEERVSWLV